MVCAAIIGTFAVVLRPAAEPDATSTTQCRWLAGDLDVHTAYTFVSSGELSLEEATTSALSVKEQAELATGRGLDFLAVTDYNDVSAQSDAHYGSDGLIWVPGYEHPFAAMAQLLGINQPRPVGASGLREVRSVIRGVRDEGGILQVAHPGDSRWPRAYGTELAPEALEVWFAGPWSYDPGKIGKDQNKAVRFYDRLLDSGQHVAATGGSNSLFRGNNKLAGVGQPTTWVCAREPTVAGVLEGIASGRTSISHEFPTQGPLTDADGPLVEEAPEMKVGEEAFVVPPPKSKVPFVSMEADADGDGIFESVLGDTGVPGASLRIGVFGAPFSVLRLITDGSVVLDQVEVFDPSFVHELDLPTDTSWIRAELFARPEDTAGGRCDVTGKVASYCDDRIGMLAFTSPMYIAPSPSPGGQ